jgi:2,4-dienoyl-CoA reductase-like NADH-dependent reductase (Old Yellow Enzyme family)
MSKVFETSNIARMTLKNRTLRSATWEGLADSNGFVRPELVKKIAELARGSVGLIVTGYLYVSPEGRGLPWQTGVWHDDHVEGLSQITKVVHDEGGLVAAQIAHAGGRTRPKDIGGQRPMGPSSIKGFSFGDTPREMTASDIQASVKGFAEAARRVKQAGFDALQLHAAHNYLISQFLSPLINQRSDAYGGSSKRRRQFLSEVYSAVREVVGADFPVLIKLNTTDGPEGGITPEEALEAAKDLAIIGVDAIEVSGGIAGSDLYRPSRKNVSKPSQEAYFRSAAMLFKQELGIPVILVGGIRSYTVAEDILALGHADYVAFSRPLICEPNLILRWSQGDRSPSKCLSCNLCLQEGLKGSGIACAKKNETLQS